MLLCVNSIVLELVEQSRGLHRGPGCDRRSERLRRVRKERSTKRGSRPASSPQNDESFPIKMGNPDHQ
jgi:hypothetical protein